MRINEIVTATNGMKADLRYGVDALQGLKEMPNESVQTIITGPPYWGDRRYTTSHDEIGQEQSMFTYIRNLLNVFKEASRVLKRDGTLWLLIGDGYSTPPVGRFNGGSEKMQTKVPDWAGHATSGRLDKVKGSGLPPKNLLGIPWRVAFGLQEQGWILRNAIIWDKLSFFPTGQYTDRCAQHHDTIFLLAREQEYHFSAKAIKEVAKEGDWRRKRSVWYGNDFIADGDDESFPTIWPIDTSRYEGEHYGTMPPELAVPCILAGSRPGDTVLDFFSGAASVGVAALRNGRNYIGIDLNDEFIGLARNQLLGLPPPPKGNLTAPTAPNPLGDLGLVGGE